MVVDAPRADGGGPRAGDGEHPAVGRESAVRSAAVADVNLERAEPFAEPRRPDPHITVDTGRRHDVGRHGRKLNAPHLGVVPSQRLVEQPRVNIPDGYGARAVAHRDGGVVWRKRNRLGDAIVPKSAPRPAAGFAGLPHYRQVGPADDGEHVAVWGKTYAGRRVAQLDCV